MEDPPDEIVRGVRDLPDRSNLLRQIFEVFPLDRSQRSLVPERIGAVRFAVDTLRVSEVCYPGSSAAVRSRYARSSLASRR